MKLICLLAFLSITLVINANQLVNGVYKIKSANFDRYWDTYHYGDTSNPDLYLEIPFSDNYQQFTLTCLSNGYYTITSVRFNRNVVAKKSANPLETLFLATPDSNDQNQQFSLVRRKDGAYLVTPRKICDKAVEAPLIARQELFLDKIECNSDLQYFFFNLVSSNPTAEFLSLDSVSSRPTD